MKKPTLSLCMIVRDVQDFITECLESVIEYVDELIIVDTGSDDYLTGQAINQIAKKHSKFFRLLEFTPTSNPESFFHDNSREFASIEEKFPQEFSHQFVLANYGKARQLGWDQATSDYLMWIDSDDIVDNAEKIPEILEAMVSRNLDTALLEYDYEQNEDGENLCTLYRLRISKKGSTSWTNPIHEVLMPPGRSELFKSVKIIHRASKLGKKQRHRPPLRNYKVLLRHLSQCKEEGKEPEPRTFFYLGNESRAFDQDTAIDWFKKYLTTSEWDEERSLAHVYTGQILEGRGQIEDARAQYAAASVAYPDKPEGHYGLSRISYYLGQYQEAVRHHQMGEIALHKAQDILHYNPQDRHYFPSIIAGTSFIETGDAKRALRTAEKGLKHSPQDIHLLAIKARALAQISVKYRPRTIAIWTGHALETWSPNSIKNGGIGGSETAVVHMAKELTKLGHTVSVYSNLPERGNIYEGVNYYKYDHDDSPIEADIFISSRRAAVLNERKIQAGLKMLWMHDIHVGPSIPEIAGNLMKYDRILCLSNWHRQHILFTYPFLHPPRVLITRNGIDPSLYIPEPKKIGNQLIFSSSPDRGLPLAIKFLKEIRKEVSDAELHVFYGFNNIDKLCEAAKTDREIEIVKEFQSLKETIATTEGIVNHGRIGQHLLAQAMLSAKIFFYPTNFMETSCISAMEAQAAGCVPISTALAALNETVHHGYLFKPPCFDEKYKKAFIARTIWCLKNEKERADIAARGRTEALKLHPWSQVADEWNDLFAQLFS